MMNCLKRLDLMGNQIGLKYESSFNFKTPLGGIFTITLGILSLTAIISFGLPLVYKTNPKVNFTTQYEALPYLNLTGNFPMALNVVKRGAFPLDNFQSYYNITLTNYNLQIANGKSIVTLTEKQMRICQDEDFNGRKNQFSQIANPTNSSLYFCPAQNQPLEIYGMIGTTKVNYLAVLINSCVNGTDIICKSNAEIQAQFQNLFIQFISSDYYFDSTNSTDPGQVYFKSTNIPITSDFYKRTYMYYHNVDYFTDEGIIFEGNSLQSYYQVDSYKEQIFFTKSAAFTPNTLSEITITISPLKSQYFRSYYKLQQLAADVGGIIKTFLMISNLIISLVGKAIVNTRIVDDIYVNKKKKPLESHMVNNSSFMKLNTVAGNTANINLTNNYLPKNDANLHNIQKQEQSVNDKIPKGKVKEKAKYSRKQISDLIINTSLDVRNIICTLNEYEILKQIILNDQEERALSIFSRTKYFTQIPDQTKIDYNEEERLFIEEIRKSENFENHKILNFIEQEESIKL